MKTVSFSIVTLSALCALSRSAAASCDCKEYWACETFGQGPSCYNDAGEPVNPDCELPCCDICNTASCEECAAKLGCEFCERWEGALESTACNQCDLSAKDGGDRDGSSLDASSGPPSGNRGCSCQLGLPPSTCPTLVTVIGILGSILVGGRRRPSL